MHRVFLQVLLLFVFVCGILVNTLYSSQIEEYKERIESLHYTIDSLLVQKKIQDRISDSSGNVEERIETLKDSIEGIKKGIELNLSELDDSEIKTSFFDEFFTGDTTDWVIGLLIIIAAVSALVLIIWFFSFLFSSKKRGSGSKGRAPKRNKGDSYSLHTKNVLDERGYKREFDGEKPGAADNQDRGLDLLRDMMQREKPSGQGEDAGVRERLIRDSDTVDSTSGGSQEQGGREEAPSSEHSSGSGDINRKVLDALNQGKSPSEISEMYRVSRDRVEMIQRIKKRDKD